MHLVIARTWPDAFDTAVLVYCMVLFVGLPALGYYFLACDVRSHMRRFRNAMVLVTRYATRLPAWVTKEKWVSGQTPRCLANLGLTIPFTEAELLHAYRQKVKQAHPDRGGDPAAFLLLQRYFEEAKTFLEPTEDWRPTTDD